MLSRLALEVRVDGEDETQQKEREQEGDQEETRHRRTGCYKRSNRVERTDKERGIGGGKEGDMVASTEMLVVRRPARNWVQLTLPGGQCRILMPEQKNSALPLAQAPDRSRPSSAWIGFALLNSRLPEKGTLLKPWGAVMIKTDWADDGDDAPAGSGLAATNSAIGGYYCTTYM